MSLFWLRFALALYGIGLIYALVSLGSAREKLSRALVPLGALGAVFHFVSLTEAVVMSGYAVTAPVHHSQSILAFVLMLLFLGFYLRYRTTSPGIFVFPLAFLLTLSSSFGGEPPRFASEALRSGWLLLHIALIFAGIAALLFSFGTSLIYLWQERNLKSKRVGRLLSRLPALETIDELGFRSLLLGFPFMTLGMIAGIVIAQESYGPAYFRDPKVILAVFTWGVYVVLLYSRWSAGWRGRRAAALGTLASLAAIGAWAANYVTSYPGVMPQ